MHPALAASVIGAPSWKEIFEVPIRVDTKEDFEAIPIAKRFALVCRPSVLHLTLLSCLGPLIFHGAANPQAPLRPLRAILFAINCLSWHAVHNLLNDWQDLDDDDQRDDSFRLAYGCHALQQGFLDKKRFLGLMAVVSVPGCLWTLATLSTPLAPASFYGLGALFFYTILFKPLALGEALIYYVWGPLMAGYGSLAAGVAPNPLVSALFGTFALCVIFGKHTDKIPRSDKKTLPKLLGFPKTLWACGATVVLPYLVLVGALAWELASGTTRTVPYGALLGLLTAFREAPATLRILRMGPPGVDRPPTPPGTVYPGTLLDNAVDDRWPLWFVSFCGWQAITTSYLMVLGSGLEWALRAMVRVIG